MPRGGKIYLLSDQPELTEMSETMYDGEGALQDFLASYPHLLAGEQIRPEEPLKWVLIKREIGIPGEQNQGDRWNLDHLFVYQNGIPTFIECKRSSDTRIRREVVGQMLDYAANAIAYWPSDKLRHTAAQTNPHLDELILSLIKHTDENDAESVIEEFWASVEANLQEGRLRLLFISDRIPPELRRIVEFLNEQMSRAEVYAIEVKQYSGGGATVLVPRVLGSVSRDKEKPVRCSTPWTDSEFLEDLQSRQIDKSRVAGIEYILKEARTLEAKRGITLSWGKGRDSGSFNLKYKGNTLIGVSSRCDVWLGMGGWKTLSLDARICLAQELGDKFGFDLQYADRLYPNIADKIFARENGTERILEWLGSAVELIDRDMGKIAQ